MYFFGVQQKYIFMFSPFSQNHGSGKITLNERKRILEILGCSRKLVNGL